MYICILYFLPRYYQVVQSLSLNSTGSCLCDHSLAQDSRIISERYWSHQPNRVFLELPRVWRAVRNFLGVEPSCRLHCHLCPLTIHLSSHFASFLLFPLSFSSFLDLSWFYDTHACLKVQSFFSSWIDLGRRRAPECINPASPLVHSSILRLLRSPHLIVSLLSHFEG